MAILGAHMSIAGGYFRAVQRAHEVQCQCVQVFTKNNNQWRAKELTEEDTTAFRRELKRLAIKHPLAHTSYLINLASPDKALWRKSVDSFVIEVERADALGIPYLVTHPGAFTCSSEAAGLKAVVRALDEVHRRTKAARTAVLLENTAGQGSCLGWRLEHLAAIIDRVKQPARVAVCLDTCHLFAAGYSMSTAEEYQATIKSIASTIGLKRVKAFHVNDSKQRLGSRVDRHAHIGRGQMGLEPFRFLLNDRRWRRTPMYLETPKEKVNGVEMDVVNLQTLRSLVAD